MGEYVKAKKESVKIGTCEDLYYTTHEEFLNRFHAGELSKDDGSINPEEYLKGEFRFRFPFIDEDHHKNFGNYEYFNRGLLIAIPKNIGVEISHEKIFIRTDNLNKKAPAIGFYIPCIVSEDFNIKKYDWHNTSENTIFEIVQQRPVFSDNGFELQTIVRCPYCNELSRLSKEEIISAFNYIYKNRKKYGYEITKTTLIALRGYFQKSEPKR